MICHRNVIGTPVDRAQSRERGPVRIGELMPELLARYGMSADQSPATPRRPHPMAAAWLGQQTLGELAEV